MSKTKRDFPNNKELRQSLNVEFKIFVPSTRRKYLLLKKSTFDKRVNDIVKFVTARFGGSTVDVEEGTYKLQNKTIKEKIAVVTVNTSTKTYNRFDEELERYLKKKKVSWEQDSIGFEYQGKFIFV